MTVAARSSILLYNDALQDATQVSLKTVVDSSTLGTAVSGYGPGNVFDPVITRSYRRAGLMNGESAILDIEVDRTRYMQLGSMAVVVAGVRAFSPVSEAFPYPVRISCSVSNLTLGGTDIYQGDNWDIPNAASVGVQSAIFVFGGLSTIASESAATQRRRGGCDGFATHLIRLRISHQLPVTSSGTIEVGRVLLMSGMYLGQEATGLSYSISDDSIVDAAFDGTRYATKRIPLRSVSGSIGGLRRHEVHGGGDPEDGNLPRFATIQSINRMSGTTEPVLYCPRFPRKSTATGFAIADTAAYTAESVLGLLERPITAQLRAGVFNGQDQLYTAGFTLRELAGRI